MAEARKIVKSGNTSFIITLPITWIRRNNLENGKLVQVLENETGDLTISAERKKSFPKEEIVTIKVDGKDEETINLEFLNAYIRDAATIIFEGKEIVSKTSKILESVKMYIGLDVIEQTTDSIVVKNFFVLDKETSPRFILRKMDIVNRATFEFLKTFFPKGFANEDFFELQKLNEQNERLFFLLQKSILKLTEYPHLMKNVQTNPLEISKGKIFSQSLLNISLALVSLGKSFLFLSPQRMETKNFKEYFSLVYTDYLNLINALSNKSYPEVYGFLRNYPIEQNERDKFLKSLEDPLLIQATNALLEISSNLRIMAQEFLI